MGRILSVITALIGLFWAQQGFMKYRFWTDQTPGGGFIPVLFGVTVFVLSLLAFFRKKQSEKAEFNYRSFIPVAAAIAAIGSIQLLGIVVSVFLFTLLWMRFLSSYPWIKSLLVSAIFTAFIFGVFRLWLRVPFPKGIFGLL
jgi:multisubunit Na+/H+ antiporter MnhB subunit